MKNDCVATADLIHSLTVYSKTIIDCLVNANDTNANKLQRSSCHGVGTREGYLKR